MTRAGSREAGDEYEAVSLRMTWSTLSLLLFMLIPVTPFLLRLQPWRPQQRWIWPLVPFAIVWGISLFGLVASWLGVKLSPGKTAARLGMLLNGTVAVLIFLFLLAFLWVRLR